jgi:hypothetical protein
VCTQTVTVLHTFCPWQATVTAAPPNPPAPESVPAIPPVNAKNASLTIPNLTFTGPDGGYWPSTVCLAWRYKRRDSFSQQNHATFKFEMQTNPRPSRAI